MAVNTEHLHAKFGDELYFRAPGGAGYLKEFWCKSEVFYCDGMTHSLLPNLLFCKFEFCKFYLTYTSEQPSEVDNVIVNLQMKKIGSEKFKNLFKLVNNMESSDSTLG